MPRRREVPKRQILPDPLYNSQLVTKFVNVVMRDGKKTIAEKLLYNALGLIQERTEEDPMKIFKKAVDNVKPVVEVKSRRQAKCRAVAHSAQGDDRRIIATGMARTRRWLPVRRSAILDTCAGNPRSTII